MGLDPGDSYSVELGTKTGNVSTRQAISEHVMTRPLPVEGLVPIDVTPGVQFNRNFLSQNLFQNLSQFLL